MKRKYLVSLVALFLLSACNSSQKKKTASNQELSSSQNTTNQITSNVAPTSQGEQTSSNPTTSPAPTSAGIPSSSQQVPSSSVAPASSSAPAPSSSTTPIPPEEDEFKFSQEEITIDISSSHSASLRMIDTFNETEDIEWSVPHSNIIRLEKILTKHDEENTITGLTVGDVRLRGEANGKITYCDIHVVNSAVKPTSGTQNISIYALNDYHGAVTNDFNIKHLGTLIKQKVSMNNTLFLDQGDTFQGTLQSNYNYGRMITDVYNAAGMSARTVGNHDFDWGGAHLIANTQANYHGYSTPVLAANVYDFDFATKTTGTEQQSEVGQEYTTFTLESGIKVGVIGLIGESCITSINTPFVENYNFISSAYVTKTLSDKLRTEENCDVIIASIHDGYSNYFANQVTSESPVSHKKYVDLVLNGHTHYCEQFECNDVTFAQFGEKGGTIGKVNLTYDYSTGSISETSVYNLSASSLLSDVPVIDTEISSIVDSYTKDVEDIKDEVLTSKLDGYFDEYENLPNLVCKSMYEAAVNKGFDVSYAIANKAREPLSGPTVTYETLYHSLPFDNVIFIVKVLGSEIMDELGWSSNSFYRGNNSDALAPIESDKVYTIACLDYLAFHCNTEREYNYFPSVQTVGSLSKDGEYYTYREVTADYLRASTGTIASSSYRDSLDHHNPSKLSETITME